MKALIDELAVALTKIETTEDLNSALNDILQASTAYHYQKNYPIAIVNTKERIKDENTIAYLNTQNLLDTNGLTPTHYTMDLLEKLSNEASAYLQFTDLVCTTDSSVKALEFRYKYPKDRWKKIQNVAHIKSIIEISMFAPDADSCRIEHTFREIIRKRKEVNALKNIGFIWIAALDPQQTADAVFKHYFDNAYTIVNAQQKYYIGWSRTLKEINMRYFVCPPK